MLGKYFDIRIKSTMSTKDENNPENGLNKAEQGVNVQGVRRAKGVYLGNPTPATRFETDDTLVLYGSIDSIKELDRRKKGFRGDREQREAVRKQDHVVEDEVRRGEKDRHGCMNHLADLHELPRLTPDGKGDGCLDQEERILAGQQADSGNHHSTMMTMLLNCSPRTVPALRVRVCAREFSPWRSSRRCASLLSRPRPASAFSRAGASATGMDWQGNRM